jgi:platelet-activating factor acetylhydrolase IB subunit alpha
MLVSTRGDGSINCFDTRRREKVMGFVGHTDSCNGATFLDSTSLATFSDDTEIKVWDLRYTRAAGFGVAVKSITGHTSWVKNICLVPGTKQILSSGFDCSIRLADINRYISWDSGLIDSLV